MEVLKSDITASLPRLIRFIPILDKSELRILKETELMWNNGILDVKVWQFTPVGLQEQNKYFNLFSIEYNYPTSFQNPNGFDAMLADMFEDNIDACSLAYQIIGAILTPILIPKKIILFQGKSNGGKTRLASIISAFMQDIDVVHLNTLSEITGDSIINTLHPIRLVNISEVGKNKLPAKQIVSLKSFADGLNISSAKTLKLLMCTNYKIITSDDNRLEEAIRCRLLVLPFNKAMNNTNPIVNSYEDCHFENEKVYVIIKALQAFSEVLNNNWQFCHEFPVNAVIDDGSINNNEATALSESEIIDINNRNAKEL